MTDLSNLRARLEGASEGSRELDALIEVAIRAVEAARTGLPRELWAKWQSGRLGQVFDGNTAYDAVPVTTSVDAALALVERCKPDWVGVITLDIAGSGMAYLHHRDPCGEGVQAFGKKPALAICIALLRALEASSLATLEERGSVARGADAPNSLPRRTTGAATPSRGGVPHNSEIAADGPPACEGDQS